MKIIIRNGVFETNSSSTHSFTILKNEDIKSRQEQYKKLRARFEELHKKGWQNLTEEEYIEFLKLELSGGKKFAISFQLKSPLSKLVWLKGLIDSICKKTNEYVFYEHNEKTQNFLREQQKTMREKFPDYFKDENLDDPIFTCDQEEERYFYKLLKEEYCAIESITEAEADNRILEEGNKILVYERILKNKERQEEQIENLLKINYNFKVFAEKYEDKVLALQDFAREQTKKACVECKGRLQCDHYFSEGALDECYCGFDDFFSIKRKINEIRKGISYKQFAKEFVSDKYVVIGVENWNNAGALNTNIIY